MKTYRSMLLGTVAAGFAVAAAVPAGAADVEKKVVLSGQVSRLVGIQDDGHSTTVNHYGNDITRSLVNIDATAESPNLTIGSRFEWSFDANLNITEGQSAAATTQAMNVNASRGTQNVRISDIFFETRYGKLSMGHGESAAMDATNSDLSGVNTAMSVAEPLSSGMGFVPKYSNWNASGIDAGVAAGTNAGVRVADVLVRHDGGRVNRIRYDTPRFAGFAAAASHGQGDVGEYRLDYEGTVFGESALETELAAAVAMQNTSATTTQFERMYLGSVSAKHSSGVNLTYAHSVLNQQSSGFARGSGAGDATDPGSETLGRRPRTSYAKVGYSQNFFGFGDTNLAIDWTLTADGSRGGDRAVKWGGGVVQNLEDYGVEVFATYENIHYTRGSSFDRTAAQSATNINGYEAINAGYFGALVKF